MLIGYENIMMQFTFQFDECYSPEEYDSSTKDVLILHRNPRAFEKKNVKGHLRISLKIVFKYPHKE